MPREKWDWTLSRIGWIDVETTGLMSWDPPPVVLEVAMIVTTIDLEEVARISLLIQREDLAELEAAASPRVKEMHDDSGLFKALKEEPAVTLKEAEARLIQVLDGSVVDPEAPFVWGGASPGSLDRPILERDMPAFYKRFHHRSLDVSALKLAFKNWGSHEDDYDEQGRARHRALGDCEDAISLAREFRALIMDTREAKCPSR